MQSNGQPYLLALIELRWYPCSILGACAGPPCERENVVFRSLPSCCLPLVLVSLLLSGCYEQTVGFPPDDDDDGSADVDQDGFPAEVDCNDENASVYPGAVEICNALDDDCDQTIDEETECYDDDLDGQTEQQGDCDDTNPNIYTGATELCDGIDND
ncbi:MAG TPA: hypothetical protein DIU15_17035, partial [Deltaproteobacteria bacterium]|nr:hypothetical protein [Deltaproteobacteria bacterium]